MDLGIGVLLALAIGAFATGIGLERERAFYPTVLIVIASYYALFAVMGGAMSVLGVETAIFAAFLVLAVAGFRTSLWIVVIGLTAHALFDLGHGLLFSNPGTPRWWPMFCLGYDLTAAGYLAWRLVKGRTLPSAADGGQPSAGPARERRIADRAFPLIVLIFAVARASKPEDPASARIA